MATQVTMADVAKFFTEVKKWRFTQNESKTVIRLHVTLKNGDHEIVVVVPTEGDVLRLIQWYPVNAPETKRQEMYELMARVNFNKNMTACQMDLDTGAIGWRTVLFVKDSVFVPSQFELALEALIWTAE